MYRVRTCILHTKHLGHRRTEDIGIEQTHLIAQLRQGDGEIGRDCALTHTALARAYGDDVLYLWQHLSHLRTWSRLELGDDLHLYVLRYMIMYGSLGSLYRTLQEWIGITRKLQYHLHLHSVDGRLICHHSAFHQVLLGARIHHCCQGVHNQLRI